MLLEVDDLNVSFRTADGPVEAVSGLRFGLDAGESLGIVGESGSGKSQTVLAALGLLDTNGSATGSVRFNGQEILNQAPEVLNQIRGRQIGMIFQDPMTSLNPHLKVSTQMTEVLELHQGMDRKAALRRAIEMLEMVQITDAAQRVNRYPHEFSGGMRQRVMIAMALLCKPSLLIADEPTTALDVTVQAQILKLLDELRAETGAALILITHDLGIVAGHCDRAVVMQKGVICEQGDVHSLFTQPRDTYTQKLLAAVPRL